jgi:hypothetical protein
MHITNPLSAAGIEVLSAYEDAATAIGRLDATAKLAAPGFRELLVLRSIASPFKASHSRMIAIVRTDGEGDDALRTYSRALREGAARARGGALASIVRLSESLKLTPPTWHTALVDDLLRDLHERTPPVLKAALAALAIGDEPSANGSQLVALTVTLTLCVGGATTDAWLTLPPAPTNGAQSLGGILTALAREARAAERALGEVRALADADEQRVRDSLGRAAYSALDVLRLLREQIVITVPETARELGLTPPTAGAAVARLVDLGIAREVTGKARSRAFAYERLVKAFEPA